MFVVVVIAMQSFLAAEAPSRGASLAQHQRITENICKDCQFNLQLRVTLGRDGLENPFSGAPSSVSMDRSGRYYVTDFRNRNEIQVFDRQGNKLRALGRRGLGPNEFGFLTCAAVRGDSLFAADLERGLVVINLVTQQEVRTIPFRQALTQLFAVSDSLFAATESTPRGIQSVATFQQINTRTGQTHPSGQLPVIVPGTSVPNLRTGAVSVDGNLWLAHRAAYEIEKWSLDNRRLLHLIREVDWFRPYTRPVSRTPLNPPHPQLIALKEIEPGLLVVVVNKPSPRWQHEIGPPITRDGRETWDFENSKLYESIIELIDVRASSVVYRTTVPLYLAGFINGGSDLYAWRTVNGVPFIDVLSLTFTRVRN